MIVKVIAKAAGHQLLKCPNQAMQSKNAHKIKPEKVFVLMLIFFSIWLTPYIDNYTLIYKGIKYLYKNFLKILVHCTNGAGAGSVARPT